MGMSGRVGSGPARSDWLRAQPWAGGDRQRSQGWEGSGFGWVRLVSTAIMTAGLDVSKVIPVSLDLGNLAAFDVNPVEEALLQDP